MKKVSLKNLNLKEVEQLSREQLKSVLGGFTGSGGGHCDSDDDCPGNKKCDSSKNLCYDNSVGYAVPCPNNLGYCITRDGVVGTCGYHSGIYGCG